MTILNSLITSSPRVRKGRIRQRTAIVPAVSAVLASLLLFPVSPASAAGAPTRTPVPTSPPFIIPAGLACSFPLQITTIENGEVATTFPADANGEVREIISGRLVQMFTNTVTGKSITANISGPGTFIFYPDGTAGVTTEGSGEYGAPPGTMGPGGPGPGAWLYNGRLTATIGTDGIAVMQSFTGTSTDLCAALS